MGQILYWATFVKLNYNIGQKFLISWWARFEAHVGWLHVCHVIVHVATIRDIFFVIDFGLWIGLRRLELILWRSGNVTDRGNSWLFCETVTDNNPWCLLHDVMQNRHNHGPVTIFLIRDEIDPSCIKGFSVVVVRIGLPLSTLVI
jgi:hypothetical protein